MTRPSISINIFLTSKGLYVVSLTVKHLLKSNRNRKIERASEEGERKKERKKERKATTAVDTI